MKGEPSINVLVVDDMGTMRKLVIRALKELGFESFVEASDGEAGWNKLKENKIDFIISDWNMPNMTGIELLKKIKGDGDLSGIPVIMLTAESEKEQVVEAISAGAAGYLIKPFTAQSLKEKIDTLPQPKAAA